MHYPHFCSTNCKAPGQKEIVWLSPGKDLQDITTILTADNTILTDDEHYHIQTIIFIHPWNQLLSLHNVGSPQSTIAPNKVVTSIPGFLLSKKF